jgi:hypothetical protein
MSDIGVERRDFRYGPIADVPGRRRIVCFASTQGVGLGQAKVRKEPKGELGFLAALPAGVPLALMLKREINSGG